MNKLNDNTVYIRIEDIIANKKLILLLTSLKIKHFSTLRIVCYFYGNATISAFNNTKFLRITTTPNGSIYNHRNIMGDYVNPKNTISFKEFIRIILKDLDRAAV